MMLLMLFYLCAQVTALMEIFGIKSRDEAVQLGMKLQRKHFIEHSSKGDHSFGDNRHYFRLHAFHTPSVLNSLRVWTQQSNDVSTAYCCLVCSWVVPCLQYLILRCKLFIGTNQRNLPVIQALG